MREHKYRAWDAERKEMFFVDSMTFRLNHDIYRVWKNVVEPEGGLLINPTTGFLMQYTGLKDKNVVEIYEADFLKDNYGRILLVEWWKYGFSFKAITKTNFTRTRDISQWFENGETPPEIIGNLPQNPELMEAPDNRNQRERVQGMNNRK